MNKDGWNTLKFASGNDHYHVVEVLLIAGANLNLKDANDCTVLMFAIQKGNYQVDKLLLEKIVILLVICILVGQPRCMLIRMVIMT